MTKYCSPVSHSDLLPQAVVIKAALLGYVQVILSEEQEKLPIYLFFKYLRRAADFNTSAQPTRSMARLRKSQ